MAAASVPLPQPAISWATLPRDVLWSVFLMLGQHEVLRSAGLVCSEWWRFARYEPALWRRVDLTAAADAVKHGDRTGVNVWKSMSRAAIDRSAGQCQAFRGRANDEVLLYLADRSSDEFS